MLVFFRIWSANYRQTRSPPFAHAHSEHRAHPLPRTEGAMIGARNPCKKPAGSGKTFASSCNDSFVYAGLYPCPAGYYAFKTGSTLYVYGKSRNFFVQTCRKSRKPCNVSSAGTDLKPLPAEPIKVLSPFTIKTSIKNRVLSHPAAYSFKVIC